MFLAVFAGWSHVSSRLMSELSPSSVLPDRLLGRGPRAWCLSGSAWVPSCWARWAGHFPSLVLRADVPGGSAARWALWNLCREWRAEGPHFS